jgi:N-acetylmuramoyl-L-alanine amidase
LAISMSARIAEHQDRTRLVIELSDPVNLRAFSLANPDRVVIDMPEVSFRLGAPPRPSGFGSIKSYRYGQFRTGNSRMVIDLNQPVSVSDTLVLPPSSGFGYRVVIDLFPTNPNQARRPGGLRPTSRKGKRCRRLAALIVAQQPPAAGGKKIIADPGHGGLDPAPWGQWVMEKIWPWRKARGWRGNCASVAMAFWRPATPTVSSAAQRVAIARADKADLFIAQMLIQSRCHDYRNFHLYPE